MNSVAYSATDNKNQLVDAGITIDFMGFHHLMLSDG